MRHFIIFLSIALLGNAGAQTFELYDDFSGSALDADKWDLAYWDGGNSPTLSSGRALLSGNTVSNWNTTEVTEAMLRANVNAANLVSGGEAHSILEFKDSDSILGIEMQLTLPEDVADNIGIGLYAIDYNVMFNNPNEDPIRFDMDLWKSSGASPEVQITWKDPVSGLEQSATSALVAAGQTVLLKFERTADTIRFFVNDAQIAESDYSRQNETFIIRAVSEAGDSFMAYVDNVRVLRDTPQEARWEPAGWVYYAWPYAYDSTEGRWHFFNQSNKQWRVNLSDSQWATLDAATGWNYYAWPYSYSSDQGAWHWYNANTQWVFDLASGEWELFGRAPILAPYTLAPYTLEPGTVAESADTITFIGNNNDYIEFEKYEDDGFSVGTYSYSHIDEMSAAFDDKGGSYVDVYDGGGRYPAESYTLNFTSETALTRSSDGKAYELYPSSDLAPTSFEGLTAAIDIYGYSNVQGGFEGFARVAFSTASSGIFYGNLTLPFNYTYLKVGPREGSLNATANNTINGSVDVSYIFHFLTVSSGYFVGEERFSNGVVESRWGTFSLD